MDFSAMLSPVPLSARFEDESYFIWGASMVRDNQEQCHLFYSRWPRELGHKAWVTHSEIAHAVSNHPLGPYKHVSVALPQRGPAFWDGLCTHNPTVHTFGDKHYLYYMGNTGDGRPMEELNWLHRNNQRIGVAISEQLDGPWERFDEPLIDVSSDPDAPDALMTSNPSICQRPDGTHILVYKAVGKKQALPFGGPVVHMVATSTMPTGPFAKMESPVFTVPGERFPAEDPFIWTQKGALWAIVKDMQGHFTGAGKSLALFTSADGLEWQLAPNPLVSRTQVDWQGKGVERLHSLERPQLWLDNGVPAVLFCAADCSPARQHAFNVHIPLQEAVRRRPRHD